MAIKSRRSRDGVAKKNLTDDSKTLIPLFDQIIETVTGQPAPAALTAGGKQRFADFVVDRARGRLIGVRELHGEAGHGEPSNTICAIGIADGGETVLAQGADFYSSPRLSPDGRALAWLTWDHPRMPWEGTTLWLAEFQDDGTLATPVRVAGGAEESICQPEWSPDGLLHFVSDRSGWWNLYRADGSVREDVVAAAVRGGGTDRVLFEAPRKDQQAWLIRKLGPEVNLANIALDDALALETLRRGLRADTFQMAKPPVPS